MKRIFQWKSLLYIFSGGMFGFGYGIVIQDVSNSNDIRSMIPAIITGLIIGFLSVLVKNKNLKS